MPTVLSQPPSRPALRQRFAALRRSEARALLRLCRLASLFHALDGYRWCGPWTQRDFVRSQVGVPRGTWLGWVRVGRLLALRPDLERAWREGRLGFGELDGMARRGEVEEEPGVEPDSEPPTTADAGAGADSEPPTAVAGAGGADSEPPTTSLERDPAYRQVRLPLPASLARRLRESLRLVRALLGGDVGDDETFAALLAEASTEVTPTCEPAEARARLRLPQARPSRPPRRRKALPPDPRVADLHSATCRQKKARQTLRLLERALHRYETARVDQEDRLLQLLLDGVHQRCGYPRLEDFAQEILDLPASSLWDRVRRARARRRNDPLAAARTEGRLTAVQEDMLDRLRRQAHVPPSDLPRWVDFARDHTTRHLRQACLWALDQRDTDYRAWERQGCPPPTHAQLRAANRPLHEVARDPTPVDLRRLARDPASVLTLTLREDTVDLLAWLVVSLQDRAKQRSGVALPVWGAVMILDELARQAWRENLQPLPGRRRDLLDRDEGMCRVPECTEQHDLHGHHHDPRSRGGGDGLENLLTLCWRHHQDGVHGRRLRVTGSGTGDPACLTWEMGLDEKGRPLRVYRGEEVVR